ncbi:MAG: hypothetical protein KDD18_02845 [Mangrovimonas sp.]|nr:hypothetical protein [Mangrovimonas sp.]
MPLKALLPDCEKYINRQNSFDKESKKFNDTIDEKWKVYTNAEYGFSFKYPKTWIKADKETKTINLSGKVIAIEINFKDQTDQTTLSVSYHLAPRGIELYKYSLSQFQSSQGWYSNGGRQIKVAGKDALEANFISSKNGKDYALNPSHRVIIVDFLDSTQTGGIELQFRTLVNDNEKIEIDKFNKTLTTFQLNN